jgi:hypothetical protein
MIGPAKVLNTNVFHGAVLRIMLNNANAKPIPKYINSIVFSMSKG